MNRLFISAAHKSSGKTTISIGLCAALSRRGLHVSPFKKGPDYIDPMWLGHAAGHPCHNLDFDNQSNDEILATLHHYAEGCNIALIEGNKGLYDGMDLHGSNSNAALAKLSDSSVVLVLDTRGTIRGVAPLLIGYQHFDPQVNIAGVILNQVGGSRHEGKLRAVIEEYTDVTVLGAVYRNPALNIDERHLGLIPSNEEGNATRLIQRIADQVEEQVDLERFIQMASTAPTLAKASPLYTTPPVETPSLRIAIARDEAFGFYYPGDLDAMQRQGAELINFDALRDTALPDCDGLFIGGGFPETQLDALTQNSALRESIRSAIEAGLPTYAECGGLMYLCRSITWQDKYAQMVGVIPADVMMDERPQGRGYIRLEETEHFPWSASDQESESTVNAHEFHYSRLENLDEEGVQFAYKVLRGHGVNGQYDGILYKNVLACYAHLRDTRQNHWVTRFLNFVKSKSLTTTRASDHQYEDLI